MLTALLICAVLSDGVSVKALKYFYTSLNSRESEKGELKHMVLSHTCKQAF